MRKRHPRRLPLELVAYLFVGLVLYLLGMIFRGPPASPDVEFESTQLLGLYLSFGSYFLAVVGWGLVANERFGFLDGALWRVLALGAAASSLIAMVFGFAGLISYDFSVLAVAWLIAGLVFGSTRWRILIPKALFPKGTRPDWSWALGAVCAFLLVNWMMRAGLAHGSTDPFFYHLLGPRQWTDAGRIVFYPGYSATIHASYWEHLFIWVNMLFGDFEGKGLIEGHLFAQMIHVGIGVTMTCAAVFAFTRAFASWAGWAWLAVLAALCSQALMNYGWLAKNDYGVTGWGIAGVLLLFSFGAQAKKPARASLVLGGLFIGMAIMGKVVYALALGPILAVWAIHAFRSGRLKEVAIVAGSVAVPMLIIMARNFAFTGDPVYPFLTIRLNLPTQWLGPTHLETLPEFLLGSRPVTLESSTGIVSMLIRHVMWIGALSLLVLPLAWFRPRLRIPALLLVACISSYAVFAVTRYAEAFYRWLSPALLIQGSIGVIVLAELCDLVAARLRRYGAWPRQVVLGAVVTAASAGMWIGGLVDLNAWPLLIDGTSATHVIRNPKIHQGGDSLTWLRLNMAPGERTITTGYQLMYYVSHLHVSAIVNEPLLDADITRLTDPVLVSRRLLDYGVRYLVDVQKWNARYYWKIGWVFDRLAMEYPEAIAYEGLDSFVLDLSRLGPAIERACLRPGGSRKGEW